MPASTNGRAQNGASRAAAGPVPAPQQPTQRVMTPTDIMRARMERKRQKDAEDDAKRQQEERERLRERARANIERRDTAGVAGTETGEIPSRRSRGQSGQRTSGGEVPIALDTGGEDRKRVPLSAQTTLNSNAPGPSSIPVATDGAGLPLPTTGGRTRGSQPQATPRPVQQTSTSRAPSASATQPQTSQARLAGGSAAATNQAQPGGPSVPPSTSQRPQPSSGTQPRAGTTSSFPHAFERWETLSSHWEGLTSFWIRRLQANSEDLAREPINQQLARQVTDLSAAGANLFHAVVELQRLRASSERKFQRWFFETRTEQERTQERIAELEGLVRAERQSHASVDTATLEAERAAAEQAKANADRVRITAERQVAEMRRELQISKDEARRAWEELGRREQEERERTSSLRAGEPTLVGGVKVLPMLQPTSGARQASSGRPSARDGPPPDRTGLSGNPTHARQEEPLESPGEGDVGYTNYDPARSETDTDPFTENGRDAPPRSSSDVPPVPAISQSYQPTSTSATAQAAARTAPTTYTTSPSRPIIPAPTAPSTSQAGGTYLTYGPSGVGVPQPPAASQAQGAAFYQHADTALLPTASSALGPTARTTRVIPTQEAPEDQRSYVPSVDDDQLSEEDEYELDERGNVRVDAAGNPILARRLAGLGSEDSDEYDVQDSLAREQAYRRQYDPASAARSQVQRPTGGVFTQGPSGQSTYAPSGPGPSSGSLQRPVDYSGSGYGSGWEAVPRHHHPTRLSDVLEEDERSRTSPSRASQRSGNLR